MIDKNDERKLEVSYISTTKNLNAYATIKIQGSSSIYFPKKNYTLKLYKNNNYRWYNSKKKSIENCRKMMNPIICDNNSWSLIGGEAHLFVADFINVFYSCYMAFNPQEKLIGNEDSRYLTIENKRYYGNVSDYSSEKYSKNMSIPNFESNSLDIKETNMAFPPPSLVRHLNLKYNFRTSSWDDIDGNQIILCDNNTKNFYKYPVSGAILELMY